MAGALAEVLQDRPEPGGPLVRAGSTPRTVGPAAPVVDAGSPAGFACPEAGPVLAADLLSEARFRAPPLLRDRGVRAIIDGPIAHRGEPRRAAGRWPRCGPLRRDEYGIPARRHDPPGIGTARRLARGALARIGPLRQFRAGKLCRRITAPSTIAHSPVARSEREAHRPGATEAALGIPRDRRDAPARAGDVGNPDPLSSSANVREPTRSVLRARDGSVAVASDGVLVPEPRSPPPGPRPVELST